MERLQQEPNMVVRKIIIKIEFASSVTVESAIKAEVKLGKKMTNRKKGFKRDKRKSTIFQMSQTWKMYHQKLK